MMQIAFPFRIDGRGRVQEAAEDAHIAQLIEQVLFTLPGERVNRPTFGSGIQQLVFAGNSEELAAGTQFLVQGALQQWLGDRVAVQDVTVDAVDSKLIVTVSYRTKGGQQQVARFERQV